MTVKNARPSKKSPQNVPNKNGREGDPISLYPLSPEEAIRAILRVPPEAKNKQKKSLSHKKD
jgi:hypothetical protein